MAVDVDMTTAEHFINKLLDNICEYCCRYGENPKYILATSRAYWMLENYAKGYTLQNKGNMLTPYLRGIEIRVVSGDGFDVFLAGEPTTLRE